MKVRATRKGKNRRRSHDGFTLLQAIIVMTVAMIVSGATIMSIRAGRPGIQLANSAHQLAGYLERARADSVRRRPSPGNESKVEILDTRNYRVTMGFGGSGTLTSRDFMTEGEVLFITDPVTIAFDWRGRPINGTEITVALQNSSGTTQVDVTGSGDVTVGSEIFQDEAIPVINLNQNMDPDVDVSPDPVIPEDPIPTPTPELEQDPTPTPPPGGDTDSTPTPTPTPTPHGNQDPGNGNPHNSPTQTPTPTPTPDPGATPTPTPAGCAPSVSTPTLSIRKNGGSGSVVLRLGSVAGTVTSSSQGSLIVSPSPVTIPAGGYQLITITSDGPTRGIFTVTFSTPCGVAKVEVTVTN